MGLTLKNAWLHAEAVQTTDLPLLVQYIHDVFEYCLENPGYLSGKKLEHCQEVTVIHFLLGLCKQLDTMDESRVMPLLAEKRIFSLLAMHLSMNMSRLPSQDIGAGIEALALLCGTEDFQTHTEHYIDSLETETALLSLKGSYYSSVGTIANVSNRSVFSSADDYLDEAAEDIDARKRLRPLLDVIRQIQRGRK
ncbi:hypothetical protein PINS_up016025 [Pythium insidiosum]|nr:hypothetical protein PINS_up007191 [Pythium insidiosum]GLE06631.1 hypothetical protein PINS_up016025 [Pythium insidiosum]